jgi:multiple sugar transport system substrate-binding protein
MPSRIYRLLAVVLTGWLLLLSSSRAERTVIEYWDKWTGAEGLAIQEVVKAFNASQDRIEVQYSAISQINMKLMLAIAGRRPPAVAGLWSHDIPVYVENNALRPLGGLAAGSHIEAKDYLPAIWNLGMYRGRLWALPSTPASTALHWNKKIFREAGLDPERPPATIAELEEFNEKITRKNSDGSFAVFGHLPEEPNWWHGLWGYWFGGTLWDGGAALTPDSPENLRAGEWIASYPKRYGVRPVAAFLESFGNFASPLNPFIRGRVAMEIQGPWMWNFIQKYGDGNFELGVAPFPSVDGKGPPVTLVESDVLVLPAGAPHVAEAWEFICYVQRPEVLEKLCAAQFKFSPRAVVSDTFWKTHPHPFIRVFYDLAASPNARPVPPVTVWSEYKNELDQAVKDIWAQRQTPADALGAVRRRMQPKLDERNERWQRLGPLLEKQWNAEEAR